VIVNNSSRTRKLALWEAKQGSVWIVGNPYLGITSGLSVIRSESEIRGNILTQAIARARPRHN
jgi:hypothetical protein